MRELNLLGAIGVAMRAAPAKLDHKRYPYLMGVELELENVSAGLRENGVRGWQMHVDDSLRNNGMEYVFAQPYGGDQALQAIDNFYEAATRERYTGGARTSTHVHVNASGITIGAFQFITGLSYVLEDALFSSIKSYRRWCGYCMPLDAMHNNRLRNLLRPATVNSLAISGIRPNQNADKYYGLNVSSLTKHGTLEFRYFPGAPSKEELLSWMDYCTQLMLAGEKLESIEVLMGLESSEQLYNLLAEYLPGWCDKLVAVAGIEPIFEKLCELQAIYTEERNENAQRRDPLLYVSPQLIGLACRIYGTNKATRDAIAGTLSSLKVMSRKEWDMSVVDARLDDSKKPLKQKSPMDGARFQVGYTGPIPPPISPEEQVRARQRDAARRNAALRENAEIVARMHERVAAQRQAEEAMAQIQEAAPAAVASPRYQDRVWDLPPGYYADPTDPI